MDTPVWAIGGRAKRAARPPGRRVLRGLDGDGGGPGLLGLGNAHRQNAVLVPGARAGGRGAHRQGNAAVKAARPPFADVVAAVLGRLGLRLVLVGALNDQVARQRS